MAKRLASTIHGLRDPETGQRHSFAAGEVPPAWAADLITNAAAWDEDEVDAEVAEAAEDGPPPKSASKGDWVAYAVSQGMNADAADDATKDDLIDLYGD